MPIHESEAVVLRQYSLSEADRIVVFFTREYGKLRAVAQGAKRPRSRVGACLEPLNHVHLQFYLKERADLARVRYCETIHAYLGKQPSLVQVYAFTYFAELVQEMVQENFPNILLFRLLLATLNAGEKLGVRCALLRYFELWTLKLNGLLPKYDYCSNCGRCVKDEGFFAWPESGVARCRVCARERGVHVRPTAAKLLAKMSEQSPEQFASTNLGDQEARDLERLTQRLLEQNLEKQLKSYATLKKVLRGN